MGINPASKALIMINIFLRIYISGYYWLQIIGF